MTEKPWFKYLTDDEREQLEGHSELVKRYRKDAGVHARWRKQIIDRASQRMRAEEAK